MRVATWRRNNNGQLKGISIHATHAGGDKLSLHGFTDKQNFNPRHPCGWRLVLVRFLSTFTTFQSTPPMRVATLKFAFSMFSILFQSTPPMRVATCFLGFVFHSIKFQSTPPMRVATTLVYTSIIFIKYFNPRHPCGWRPVNAKALVLGG